jgi:hypothetical protein
MMDTAHRSRILYRTVAVAATAPSPVGTAPGTWRISEESAHLYARRGSRQDRAHIVGCGVALHRVRVAVRAAGFAAKITYLPVPGEADLLATVHLGGRLPPHPAYLRLFRVMAGAGHPVEPQPVNTLSLLRLRVVAEAHGASLALPTGPESAAVAAAVGGTPCHRASRYGVLYTVADQPGEWLAAGEALSAILLTAAADGIPAAVAGDPQDAGTRRLLVETLGMVGYPVAVVRFGSADRDAGPPRDRAGRPRLFPAPHR